LNSPETWAELAIELTEYIETLEQEIEDKKLLRAEAIRNALDGGIKTHGGFGFQVRYRDGEKFVIDADMLRIQENTIYQELMERAVKNIKLKPSRKEVYDELVSRYGEETADKEIEECGFRVQIEPQYIMTKGASE